MRREFRGRWPLLMLAAAPCSLPAAEGTFALDAGVGRSSNIARTDGAEQSETIVSVGSDFFLAKESRRLSTNLAGELDWLDYLDDTFDSEVVGSASASLRASLIDGRLAWSLVDRFGQVRRDVLSSSNPGNREYLNQFATGPDLTLRLGSRVSLLASTRYMLVDYDDSPFDSKRWQHSVGLRRELSGNSGITLRTSVQDIDPDEAAGYQMGEAVLAYDVQGARTSLSLSAGAARVERRGLDSDSGAIFRADIVRNLTARSSLTLALRREFGDAGSSLGGWSGDGLPSGGSGSLNLSRTTDPFMSTSVQLGWRVRGRLTSLELSGTWRKEDLRSGSTAPDREEWRARLRGTRRIGPRTRLGIDVRRNVQELQQSGRSADSAVGVDLGWQIGRHLSLVTEADFTWFERRGVSGSADESRYWLRLRYSSDAT